MKKTLFIILILAFCSSLAAQHYTSRDFKNVSVMDYKETTYGASNDENSNFVPTQNRSHFVPQSKASLDFAGLTHYISATNSNSRNTVNWSPDGKTCAASWTLGGVPSGSPLAGLRGTGLNYFDFDSKTWGPMPNVESPFGRIEVGAPDHPASWRPGWGTHVFTEEGECIISHCTDEGGMLVNYKEKAFEGEWTQFVLKGPVLSNGKTDILWPTVIAVGNTIHMVCVTSNDANVTYTHPSGEKISTCPLYFRSTDGGKTWEDVKPFDFSVFPLNDQKDVSADQYVLTAKGDHVVLAYARGSVVYLESFNGGNTWKRTVVYDCGDWHWDATGPSETVGPTMYARTLAVAIDDNDAIHIAFNAKMSIRPPSTQANYYSYYPFLCGLYTWKEGHPLMTKEDMKIEYDVVNEKFIDYGYDLLPNFMDAPDLLGFGGNFYWWGTIDKEAFLHNFGVPGYISHPRLIAQNGKVYLMYSSIIEQPMLSDEGKFYRGVFMTVSNDNGETYNQRDSTSWLSYHPLLFDCDFSNYEHSIEDTTHNGKISVLQNSENGYPTMSVNVKNNTLVLTWFNDYFTYPVDEGNTNWVWQQTAFSIIGYSIKLSDVGVIYNTNQIWTGEFIKGISETPKNTINTQIYPNPATDIVNVKVDADSPYTLTVTNIMGQVVQTIQAKQNTVQLNVANYAPGVYIVNVKTKTATSSQKLIVK